MSETFASTLFKTFKTTNDLLTSINNRLSPSIIFPIKHVLIFTTSQGDDDEKATTTINTLYKIPEDAGVMWQEVNPIRYTNGTTEIQPFYYYERIA